MYMYVRMHVCMFVMVSELQQQNVLINGCVIGRIQSYYVSYVTLLKILSYQKLFVQFSGGYNFRTLVMYVYTCTYICTR